MVIINHDFINIRNKIENLDITKYIKYQTAIIDNWSSIPVYVRLIETLYNNVELYNCTKEEILFYINGHVEITKYVRYIHDNYTTNYNSLVVDENLPSYNVHTKRLKLIYIFTRNTLINPIDMASSYGDLSLVEFFFSIGNKCTTDAIDYASSNGHIDIIQYLHYEQCIDCSIHAIDNACRNGHLNIVLFLFHLKKPWSIKAFLLACHHGQLNIVMFLSSLINPVYINDGISIAQENNHHNIFDYLVSLIKENHDKKKYIEINNFISR